LPDKLPAWNITLVDDSGTSGKTNGTMVSGLSASAHLSALAGLVSAMAPITGCVIVRYSVTYTHYEVLTGITRSNAPIATQSRFTFIVDDPLPLFSPIIIPIADDLTVTVGCQSGLNIDTSLSIVQSFIDLITDGIWCDPFGVDIIDLCSAYLVTVS
jgi:hypothetical protein